MAKRGAPYGNKNAVGSHSGVTGAVTGAAIGGLLGTKAGSSGNLARDITRSRWGLGTAVMAGSFGGPTGLGIQQYMRYKAKKNVTNAVVSGVAGAVTGAVIGGVMGRRKDRG
jgi:hypothetical protein